MDTIRDFSQKIKVLGVSLKEEFLLGAIIVLVALASFGLGRISVSKNIYENKETVMLKTEVKSVSSAKTKDTEVRAGSGGEVVVSKSGKKYHYPWCAGAKQIAEKNKVTFPSSEEARKAGYTPASNCKGLQ